MRWVTWEHVGIDRIACAWLISRFIDPEAEFLFVPSGTVSLPDTAEPFDIPGVRLSHRREHSTFHAFLDEYGSAVVGGLCDAAESGVFRRALGTADLEARGFFVCDADLEDELIRALGTARVEQIIAAEGELASLRTMQRQPAQRDRTLAQHLHRFMGVRSARKYRYARLLVEALEPDDVPRPLVEVLAHVLSVQPPTRRRAGRREGATGRRDA
jgi:hypothetical protein